MYRLLPRCMLSLALALGISATARAQLADGPLRIPDEPSRAEAPAKGDKPLEPGDNKAFTVVTDDDITALKVGQEYSSEGSRFKVTEIKSAGSAGGSFVVQRVGGRKDPGNKWTLVSGDGPTLIKSRETVWGLFQAGGFFMYPIAACGVATIIIALNSIWVYRRSRLVNPRFVDEQRRLLKEGNIGEFEQRALKEAGLFAQVCRAMATRYNTSTPEDIKARVEIEASKHVSMLKSPMRALSFITAASPLLGLLGTVVGMVMCFESMAFDSATGTKTVELAKGIRVALFTTVGGLVVAIPSLFVYYLFSNKLGKITSECESLAEEFLHDIATLKRRAVAAARRKRDEAAPAAAAPAAPSAGIVVMEG